LNDAERAGENTAKAFDDGVKSGLEMHSPSRVMVRNAENAVSSFTDEVKKQEPKTADAGTSLAEAFLDAVAASILANTSIDVNTKQLIRDMHNAAKAELNANRPESIGTYMTDGVANGLSSGTSIVSNAAYSMINAALEAMRAAARTNSPSLETKEIASSMADGLVVGADNSRDKVYDAGFSLAESMTSGVNDGIVETISIGAKEITAAAEYANKTRLQVEESAARQRIGIETTAQGEQLSELLSYHDHVVNALRGHHNELVDMVARASREERETIGDNLLRQLNYRIDMIDRHVQAVQDQTQAVIAEYEKQHRALVESLDYSESEILRALQGRIDALDQQTEAENRALREQQDARRLADLQAAIDAAETNEERIRATERFNDEMERQQRDAIQRQRRDEQASIREQMQEVRAAYQERRREAQKNHGEQVRQAKENERVQLEFLQSLRRIEQESFNQRQQDLTAHHRNQEQAERQRNEQQSAASHQQNQQLEQDVRQGQENIINILNQKIPLWAEAGRGAGQAFLDALQSITPAIESEVQRIMSLISQANKAGSSAGNAGSSIATPAAAGGAFAVPFAQAFSAQEPAIPVLHDGGISMKEQPILADKHEAILPLAALGKMMEGVIAFTADKMVTGFSENNNTSSNTTNNTLPMEFHLHWGTDDSYNGAYNAGSMFAEETRRALRSKGIPIPVGGG